MFANFCFLSPPLMLPWMKGGWRVWRDALARVRLFLVFFLSHRWFYCSKTVLSIFCFEILKYPPCVFQTGPHGARHLISGNANKQTKQSEKSRLRSSNNLRRRIFLNQKKTPKKNRKTHLNAFPSSSSEFYSTRLFTLLIPRHTSYYYIQYDYRNIFF